MAHKVRELKWEITEILDKRETILGKEYMVCWKSTWLLKRELGNAQKLLREFEAKGREQHGRKRRKSARTDTTFDGYILSCGICFVHWPVMDER